jgi:hypothetical protein
LKVDVVAPDKLAWDVNGQAVSASGVYNKAGMFVPVSPPDGTWITFSSQESK